MRIDFHTHGKLAKKLPFSSQYTNWLFEESGHAGLDAICLTEHFNTIGFDTIYQYISTTFPQEGDSFLAGNIRIFPGMEIDISQGGHILAVGKMDEILELNYRLEANKVKGSFVSFEQLLELTKDYELLIGAGHPFRPGGHIPDLPKEQLLQFDFIDLNGKDMALNDTQTKKDVYSFAKQLNLPVVAGSDTHQSFQYGCISNRFLKECYTIKELSEELKLGNYEIEISDTISFQVKTAGLLKQSLKEIHNLGGDYVSVLLEEQ